MAGLCLLCHSDIPEDKMEQRYCPICYVENPFDKWPSFPFLWGANYFIQGRLGEGGMGAVYLAAYLSSLSRKGSDSKIPYSAGKPSAIKFIKITSEAQSRRTISDVTQAEMRSVYQMVIRFQREQQAMANLTLENFYVRSFDLHLGPAWQDFMLDRNAENFSNALADPPYIGMELVSGYSWNYLK